MKKTKKIPKKKGYDTYINKDGVKCIKNFNPYNMRKGASLNTLKPIMNEVRVKIDLDNGRCIKRGDTQ